MLVLSLVGEVLAVEGAVHPPLSRGGVPRVGLKEEFAYFILPGDATIGEVSRKSVSVVEKGRGKKAAGSKRGVGC